VDNSSQIQKKYKERTVIGFVVAVILTVGVCALTGYIAGFMSNKSTHTSGYAGGRNSFPTVVIDAGHGGMDSGTVGVDGSLEKDINIAVAKRLYILCKMAGIDCVMTRSDDRMLVDDSIKSHRKMHDLKNRLAVANTLMYEGKDVVLISIHMNNFTDPKYSGLQVWYSKNSNESARLAAAIQGYARTWLDTENDRETKRATSSIYILDRAEMPAVLVECGFLSNPEECALLVDNAYQNRLVICIFASLCDWMGDIG